MNKIILVITGLLLTATLDTSCQKALEKPGASTVNADPIVAARKPYLEFKWDGKLFQNESDSEMYFEQYFGNPQSNPVTSLYWENYHDSIDLYLWTKDIKSLEQATYEVTIEFGTVNGFDIDEAGRGTITITKLENGYISGTFSGEVLDFAGDRPKPINGKFENVGLSIKYN